MFTKYEYENCSASLKIKVTIEIEIFCSFQLTQAWCCLEYRRGSDNGQGAIIIRINRYKSWYTLHTRNCLWKLLETLYTSVHSMKIVKVRKVTSLFPFTTWYTNCVCQ